MTPPVSRVNSIGLEVVRPTYPQGWGGDLVGTPAPPVPPGNPHPRPIPMEINGSVMLLWELNPWLHCSSTEQILNHTAGTHRILMRTRKGNPIVIHQATF